MLQFTDKSDKMLFSGENVTKSRQLLIDILEISSQEKLHYVINMRVYLRMHTTITDFIRHQLREGPVSNFSFI